MTAAVMPTRVPSGRSFAYAVKMPLQTASLQFTRKVQTIECLETERPQSQDTVRHILLNAVGEVEKKLATIDQTFRGRAKTYSDCIRKYVPPILAMMKLNEINVIFNKAQVDRILNYICPPDTHIGSRMLRDIYEKTLQYVPDCFQEIFKDLKRILFFLDKYCLSFSTTEQKKYMDTAFHYEQKRQELINLININIEDVGKNFERFCNDGLDLKCFGIQVNDIARACECDTVLFLLMFPQACVNIENACKGIRMWIQTDEEYADYIKDDIETIEKKIESHTRAVRQFLSKSHQLEVQMNHTRRQCSDLENEIQKLQSRETSLQRQTKGLKRELSDLDLELGTLEHEKILVSRGVLATNPKNTMNTLNRKTIYVKEKINSIETRMLQLTQKTEFINQKREDLNEVRDAAATLRNETKKAKQDHLNFQLELQAMKKALEQLKKIYLLKNSPESIKKVFYGLPVKAKHQRPQAAARTRNPVTPASGKRPKSNPVPDDLEKAIGIASHYIGKDWIKLYFSLPFIPSRGQQNLTQDLDDINKKYLRASLEEQAKLSLQRWRRLHIRATVQDLKLTLEKIGRKQIIDRIDERLKRRSTNPKPRVFRPARVAVALPKIKMAGDKSMVIQTI